MTTHYGCEVSLKLYQWIQPLQKRIQNGNNGPDWWDATFVLGIDGVNLLELLLKEN